MQFYKTHSPESICRSLEQWSSWTQHDIDSDKTIVDTVNALIAVVRIYKLMISSQILRGLSFQAAFIAGVQSQVVSFSMGLPQSQIANATNALGFVGLLLDVIGTFLGVIHAIVLQRRIKENTAVLHAMTQITTSMKAIQKFNGTSSDKLTEEQLREIDPDDPEEQVRRAQQILEVLQHRFEKSNVSSAPLNHAMGLLRSVAVAKPGIGMQGVQLVTLIRSLFGLGHTPLVAMGLGVLSLVVSVVMFAAESTALSSVVWLSCVGVLAAVIGLSLLPITFVSFLVNILAFTVLLGTKKRRTCLFQTTRNNFPSESGMYVTHFCITDGGQYYE